MDVPIAAEPETGTTPIRRGRTSVGTTSPRCVWVTRKREPRASKVWLPPPNWPSPGWVRQRGWVPDPSWPPAPPGHAFWVRTRGGRRRRDAGYAGLVVLLLLFGGCTVQSLRDPCFFDPPPGDQLILGVANDTTKTVTIVDGREDACSTADKPTTIAAGATGYMPLEGCQGGTMGVLDVTSHRLTACIAEPIERLQLKTASRRRVGGQTVPAGPRRSTCARAWSRRFVEA